MTAGSRPQDQPVTFYRIPIALVATLLTIFVTIALFLTGFFLNQGSTRIATLETRTEAHTASLSEKIDAIQSRLQAIETLQSAMRPGLQTDHDAILQLVRGAAVSDALASQMTSIIRELKTALDGLSRDQIAYRSALDRIELELHQQHPTAHK